MSESSASERTNAPSDTLLGKLQRGQGRGYLDALAAPRAEAQECLLECLIHDPRWDGEIESRAEQYGELAVALGLPTEPIDQFLRTTPHDAAEHWPHSLVLDTLLQMLRRGRDDAGEILRGYIAYGAELSHVLYELHVHQPELLLGLDDVVLGRLDEPDVVENLYFPSEPIPSWCRIHPRLDAAFADDRERQARFEAWRDSLPDYANLPLEEALAAADQQTHIWIRRALAGRARPEDAPRLLDALDSERPWQSMVALGCLKDIPHPDLIEPLARFLEALAERPPALGFQVCKVLLAIAHPRVLELGRGWIRDECFHLMMAGQRILEARATDQDLPVIRALLDSDQHADRGPYRICAGLEMAARLSCRELLPALAQHYHELHYAWGRKRAVKAMLANAPDVFDEQHAYECLWDCECETREMAIQRVPLTAEALVRLRFMADDPVREERGLVAARLAV